MTEKEYYTKIYDEALDAQGSYENAVMAVRNAPAYVDPVEALAKELFVAYEGPFSWSQVWSEISTECREAWFKVAKRALALSRGGAK